MSEQTKACNLTEDEVKHLIQHHGYSIDQTNSDHKIDRMSYLNKRLKEFKKADTPASNNEAAQAVASTAGAAGWGTSNA